MYRTMTGMGSGGGELSLLALMLHSSVMFLDRLCQKAGRTRGTKKSAAVSSGLSTQASMKAQRHCRAISGGGNHTVWVCSQRVGSNVWSHWIIV
jgi:hypothetical protein